MKYHVMCDTGETYRSGEADLPKYGVLSVKGRTEWKTKRTAAKHAREYKATHLRDAWVNES